MSKAAALIALLVMAAPVPAHEWYESACCSGRDCRPVEDGVVQEKADGVVVQGFGILSYSDARLRWSRDDRDHLCIPSPGKLNCVYRRLKVM